MLSLRRFPRKTALLLAVLAVLLSVPHPGHAARSTRPQQAAPGQAAPGQPIIARTLAARSPAASSGGLCSVPGIGDIGGLLGFCSLGTAGLTGALNDICAPSTPDPEPASSGIDSLVKPPNSQGPGLATPYNRYGVAGQYWAATNLKCSDMTSLIGNSVAGMIFDVAKSIDRVTITVYQSAAGEGIIAWLRNVTDRLITGLGNAIYFPYVAVVVIIGAIWLAWQGLIRKRGTRTIEGTIWMVVACAAAIWLIGRPADFTGVGKGVSDGITTTLNAAFAKLPSPGQNGCMPVQKGDPQIQPASYSYTSGNTVVDQNANELWSVLVCKPWLDGELGTTAFSAPGGTPTAVNRYARQLLWAQAIAVNEKATPALIKAKQATYTGIGQSIQQQNPGIYPLFQGKEWTTRLEIAFSALLAAVVAGVLVLLISVTLILLKLGFLLLLIVGPFFLLIGTHPGFGRVVAVRWFEMLVGVLLKQAAIALVLSVLLYCYALIMGTADSVLPWALKILMIALVTIAVFIYRRPFQHLFSAVGYGAIGSRERAEQDLGRAGATLRGNTIGAATAAVPGFAAYRAARWARHNPAHAASLALGAASIGGSGAAMAAGAAGADGTASTEAMEAYPDADGDGRSGGNGAQAGGRAGLGARVRAWGASAGGAAGRDAPPLNLPSRETSAAVPPSRTRSGDSAPAGRLAAGRPAPDAATAAAVAGGSSTSAAGGSAGGSAGGAASGPPQWPGAAARRSAAQTPPGAAPPPGGHRTAPGTGSSGLWSGTARPSGSPPTRQPGSSPSPAAPSWPRPAAAPAPAPARQPAPPPARQPAPPPARQPAPPPARQPAPPPARQPAPPPARQPASHPASLPAALPRQPASPPAWPAGAAGVRQPGSAPAWAARPAPARPAGAPPAQSAGRQDSHGEAGAHGAHAAQRGESAALPTTGTSGTSGTSGTDRPESPAPFWLRPIRRRR
jgi:TrbL/VirB6 plasmid conjugal transfer protein